VKRAIGIDEAGRGPVLGPLVMCAYAIDERKLPALKKAGVKDSKLLLPKKRRELRDMLLKEGEAIVVELNAIRITKYMRKKISLNELEAEGAAEALAKLDHSNTKEIIVDSPDPKPAKFGLRIAKYFDGPRVRAENKADYNYTVVAAASIVAKERREECIAGIKEKVGFDFGSGYSHDEKTVNYLKEHINDKKLQPFIRHCWATAKRLKVTQCPLGDWA